MGLLDQTPTPVDRPERFKKYGQRQLRDIEICTKLIKDTEGMDINDLVKKHKKGINSIPISDSKKKSVFNDLKREERETMKLMMNEIDILEKTRSNINNLKNTLKRIHSDIKKGFDDDVNINMSFVSKKSKGIPYIKCRVWWDGGSDGTGGQREVQIGSIPKIIDTFNGHIENKEDGFPKKKLSEDLKELSWDKFKEDIKLMKLLRMISKPLFKQYLIKRLLSRRTLGYRIRTKDSVGVSKHFDSGLLGSQINHLDQVEIDNIIKQEKQHGDSEWYKRLLNKKKSK